MFLTVFTTFLPSIEFKLKWLWNASNIRTSAFIIIIFSRSEIPPKAWNGRICPFAVSVTFPCSCWQFYFVLFLYSTTSKLYIYIYKGKISELNLTEQFKLGSSLLGWKGGWQYFSAFLFLPFFLYQLQGGTAGESRSGPQRDGFSRSFGLGRSCPSFITLSCGA